MSSWSESRAHRRMPTSAEAWIESAKGRYIRCTVTNITLAGAQLQLDQHALIPSRFSLIVRRDAKNKFDCRLIWRKAELLGVRFSQPQKSYGSG